MQKLDWVSPELTVNIGAQYLDVTIYFSSWSRVEAGLGSTRRNRGYSGQISQITSTRTYINPGMINIKGGITTCSGTQHTC